MGFHSLDLPIAVCRPALPKDTPDVLELTRHIWGGEDYVPEVWAEWMADPEGLLAVVEYGGRVRGLYKLSRLSPQEWWLHGLRVHPEFRRLGLASRLHDYLLAYWQRQGSGVVRLATASFRKPVHRLCERTGFEKVGELTTFSAETPEISGLQPSQFIPLQDEEILQALAWTETSPLAALSGGLMDLGWEWARPGEPFLISAVRNGLGWWWRGRDGLVLFYDDEEASQKRYAISLLACPLERLAECLKDCRALAAGLSGTSLGWIAPLEPDVLAALEMAGFERKWDASMYVYEKGSQGYDLL